ncbi:phage antirepressor [Actinacidiphila sp. ITFR-21]|uniref:phage antirepressor n=1 Tax=Actinacidiphila sp. ITFR-21 TaxID=3075199 RepID=UPI00288B18FA|nr:BRO family protein [Streptomyces sp. ITFR-21]WNI17601.1 BRO family protein [Streptomyces sp. ITFR-21]WNI17741.1 BRO family protein [Streptomyces sp. ITFR-21]
MADVIPLVFPETNKCVRVLMINGAPWWVARDVCSVLEMERPDAALRGLDDDEKGAHTVSTPGGDQRMSVINESGLYSMILRSRKAEARAFKKWITGEVLPEIRRTGGYGADKAAFDTPRTFGDALLLAAAQWEELEATKKQLEAAAPKVEAADAYFASEKYLLVREAAKLLGLREKGLRTLLLEKGFIFRHRNAYGDSYYDVAARYADAGLFATRVYSRMQDDGGARTTYTVYITPKGMEVIRKIIRDLADRRNVPAVRHGLPTRTARPLTQGGGRP